MASDPDLPAASAETLPGTIAGDSVPRVHDEPAHVVRGATVGRYVVLSELGAGGMGVVYAAYDPELDRKVALKLLRPDVRGSADSGTVTDARTRLLREAQALAKLAHPNVVPVHDVGEHAGAVWLAMEYVEGETLGEWLAARPRRWPEVLGVMRPAGEGLSAAHRAGLLHRDFKPDNVMVGADGRVRVMDLGLARAIRGERIGSTNGSFRVRRITELPCPRPICSSSSAIISQRDRALSASRRRYAGFGRWRW